jgi:mono/diheme cytochrome c family protein
MMSIAKSRWSLFVGIASLTMAGTASAFDAVTLEDYSGEELFWRFCSSCHGTEARGDGPVSGSLKVAVPDLTTIATRHGNFPAATVRNVIDGRRRGKAAHGTREMPVWGFEFRVEEGGDVNAQLAVRSAIDKLVEYLRSIQRAAAVRETGSAERR